MDALDFERIPPLVKRGIDNYQLYGLRPGDTVLALLSGDMYAAFTRADDDTRAALAEIIGYIVRTVTEYGTPARVRDWLALRAAARSA
jgi:hypothetical protein